MERERWMNECRNGARAPERTGRKRLMWTYNGWCWNFSGRLQISGLVVRGLGFDPLLSYFWRGLSGLPHCVKGGVKGELSLYEILAYCPEGYRPLSCFTPSRQETRSRDMTQHGLNEEFIFWKHYARTSDEWFPLNGREIRMTEEGGSWVGGG